MNSKKKYLIIFLVITLLLQTTINATLYIYNKKSKISFEIDSFYTNHIYIENNIITYYDKLFLNNPNDNNIRNILFIHDLLDSSLNLNTILKDSIYVLNNLEENFRLVLVDLPGHGNSFKKNNFDYSFENISSLLITFLNSIQIGNTTVICQGISSNIGINMIPLNDKIIDNILLINPKLNYNKLKEFLVYFTKTKFLMISNFINMCLHQNTHFRQKYISSYFNNNFSLNKFSLNMILDNNLINTNNITKTNTKIYAIITKNYSKQYENILSILNKNFTSIILVNKENLYKYIIKNRL